MPPLCCDGSHPKVPPANYFLPPHCHGRATLFPLLSLCYRDAIQTTSPRCRLLIVWFLETWCRWANLSSRNGCCNDKRLGLHMKAILCAVVTLLPPLSLCAAMKRLICSRKCLLFLATKDHQKASPPEMAAAMMPLHCNTVKETHFQPKEFAISATRDRRGFSSKNGCCNVTSAPRRCKPKTTPSVLPSAIMLLPSDYLSDAAATC